jgi:hypothetical protein
MVRGILLGTAALLAFARVWKGVPAAAGDRQPGDTIRVVGPMVIAYFPVTQAEVDAEYFGLPDDCLRR